MGKPTQGGRHNRREEYARKRAITKAKHAKQKAWQTFMLIIGLVMLFGAGGGVAYYFGFYTKHEFKVTDYETSFRVVSRSMLNGEVIAAEMERGAANKEFADWVDPRYYLICEANTTKARIVYEVSESTFNNATRGKVFTISQTERWKVIDRTNPSLIEVLEQTTGINLDALK